MFNHGEIKHRLPTTEEYHCLNKHRKKYYFKLVQNTNPDLYYDPKEHVSKSKIHEYHTCGINGCEKQIKGLGNLSRHRSKCRVDQRLQQLAKEANQQ